MDRMDQIEDLCRRMEDLAADGGMPRFDRVRYSSDPRGPGELWFLWEERKLAVVVELDSGPDALAKALARATGGDAVLN